MSKNNIAIIDGSYYVYKFYHALKSLRTSKSYPTGAIYGFIKFINSFEKKYPFELLLVVFDAPVKTFKSSKCNLYKSNRRAINYELYFQFKIIFEFCELIGLKSYLINGYEADDVIADLTRQYTNIGYKVFILSGDKDLLQLVSPTVSCIYQNKIITPDKFIKEWGISPKQLPDYLALCGDKCDNIPSVPGIGPVGARKLLAKYESVDNLLRSQKYLESNIKDKIYTHQERIILSYKLAKLDDSVYLPLEHSKINSLNLYNAQHNFFIRKLLIKYELFSLLQDVKITIDKNISSIEVTDVDVLEKLFITHSNQTLYFTISSEVISFFWNQCDFYCLSTKSNDIYEYFIKNLSCFDECVTFILRGHEPVRQFFGARIIVLSTLLYMINGVKFHSIRQVFLALLHYGINYRDHNQLSLLLISYEKLANYLSSLYSNWKEYYYTKILPSYFFAILAKDNLLILDKNTIDGYYEVYTSQQVQLSNEIKKSSGLILEENVTQFSIAQLVYDNIDLLVATPKFSKAAAPYIFSNKPYHLPNILLSYYVINSRISHFKKMLEEKENTYLLRCKLDATRYSSILQTFPTNYFNAKIISAIQYSSDIALIQLQYWELDFAIIAALSQNSLVKQLFASSTNIYQDLADIIGIHGYYNRAHIAKNITYFMINHGNEIPYCITDEITKEEFYNYLKLYRQNFFDLFTFINNYTLEASLRGYFETLIGRKIEVNKINLDNDALKSRQISAIFKYILRQCKNEVMSEVVSIFYNLFLHEIKKSTFEYKVYKIRNDFMIFLPREKVNVFVNSVCTSVSDSVLFRFGLKPRIRVITHYN